MISAKRVLSIFLATAVLTPVLGVAASGTASATTTLPADLIALLCEHGALVDTRTDAQVNTFMRTDRKSMHNIAVKETGAAAYYNEGWFGEGIDIALIDSGVTEVPGLTLDKKNLVHGPDLSWESQAVHAQTPNPALWQKDTYFHGTHLAGIMTGRDAADVDKFTWDDDPTRFMGIAPKARTLSLKVADAGGATDVTQVIAAIDWVVEHAHDPGYNVRVINLSYGLNSATNANADALSYAVQQAWNAGIVVVAAAGNEGKAGSVDENGVASADLGLTSPAFTRDIIAVGSYGIDENGKYRASDYSTGSSNVNMRMPDFVAFGESLPSLRVAGSAADRDIIEECETTLTAGKPWKTPVVGAAGRFVKASGTSQAAALTSGAVALMLSKSPGLTPEQVKKALLLTTLPVDGASKRQVGEGKIRLDLAISKVVKDSNPTKDSVEWSSLDAARGDSILESPLGDDCYSFYGIMTICSPRRLTGNVDWVGKPIDAKTLMAAESVNPKKSPYCLDVSDYITQKAFTNKKCESGASAFSPKAWTTDVDKNGLVFERWNSGPGLFYTGEKVTTSSKATPLRYSPMKWPAPAWLGMAWADMDWTELQYVNGGWTVSSTANDDDFTKSRLRAFDFTKSRLRADDFTKSRLRGSNFTKSRLKGTDFSKSRLKDFGWKEFAWS